MPKHVSLVAIPEASISTLHGIYDVLNCFSLLQSLDPTLPDTPPFEVEIVGVEAGPIKLATGLSTQVHHSVDEVDPEGIIIVPSVILPSSGWPEGSPHNEPELL